MGTQVIIHPRPTSCAVLTMFLSEAFVKLVKPLKITWGLLGSENVDFTIWQFLF